MYCPVMSTNLFLLYSGCTMDRMVWNFSKPYLSFPLLENLAICTGGVFFTTRQCAAVSTTLGATRVPPQKCSFPYLREAMKGSGLFTDLPPATADLLTIDQDTGPAASWSTNPYYTFWRKSSRLTHGSYIYATKVKKKKHPAYACNCLPSASTWPPHRASPQSKQADRALMDLDCIFRKIDCSLWWVCCRVSPQKTVTCRCNVYREAQRNRPRNWIFGFLSALIYTTARRKECDTVTQLPDIVIGSHHALRSSDLVLNL